jgi:hypothetical protein
MPIIDIEDEQKLRRLCSVVYSRFSGAWLSKRARSAPVLGRREDKGAEALALAVDVHSYCQCALLYSDFPRNEIVSRIRRTRMINKHICTLGWAAAFAVTTVSAAAAAPFDGNWNVIVYTTNGHCGITNWQVGIAGGQVYSAGAMLGGYPAGLGGAVAPSGQVRFNGVAGPRNASGGGRFVTNQGSGTWAGVGPSGRCSGVWSATRG